MLRRESTLSCLTLSPSVCYVKTSTIHEYFFHWSFSCWAFACQNERERGRAYFYALSILTNNNKKIKKNYSIPKNHSHHMKVVTVSLYSVGRWWKKIQNSPHTIRQSNQSGRQWSGVSVVVRRVDFCDRRA